MPIFWTIQYKGSWEYAKKLGYLEGNPDHIKTTHIKAYKWIMEQMVNKLPSYNGEYPIWLFLSKPDALPNHVILEIELDDRNVLLSDFYDFQDIINNRTLYESYDEDYEEYKFAEDITTKDELKRKSWGFVFDLNRKRYDLDGNEIDNKDRLIQGTTGRIELSKIQKVQTY